MKQQINITMTQNRENEIKNIIRSKQLRWYIYYSFIMFNCTEAHLIMRGKIKGILK